MSQPTYSSADGYIGEDFVTLVFDVALSAANPPPVNAFAVQVNGTGVTVTGVTVNSTNKTVILAISAATLTAGDIVEFSYSDPTGGNDVNAIQGTDGTDAATFSASLVVMGGRPGPSAPPAPTLSSGSDSGTVGDGITSDNTPTLSGTVDPNAAVKLYDTDGTTLLGTTTADGSGNWSITSSTLADATHTLKITQTDSGNNTSSASSGLSLKIDTVASAPASLAVASGSDSGTLGDGISNSATPQITGTAEANAAVMLYDTDGTTLLGSATANGSGAWSITSTSLTEGSHTLTAKQTDRAGNVSSPSSNFTYVRDTVGPVGMALSATSVQMASATNGSTIATLSSTDITSVTYGFAVGNGTIDADNGKFTISGTSLATAQSLTAGAYHIYLSGTDAAGNAAYQIFTINVTDAPTVSSIVRAASASATVASAATSVSYTVTFSESVTGVDSSDFTVTTTGSASGAITSVSGSGAVYTVTVGSLGGDGTMRLDLNSSGTGIQNGGTTAIATGYTSGASYTLDHTAPTAPGTPAVATASDTGISATDGITTDTAPVISGTAEANSTVTLYDTDGTTVIGAGTADGSGNWSISASKLGAGSHTVTAKATDAAGNTGNASSGATLVIDTTAPSVNIASSASALKVGETATITFTFSEDPGSTFMWDGSTGDVTVSGGTLGAISGSGLTRTATFTPTASTNGGSASIAIGAGAYTDTAGNSGGAGSAATLTYDTLAPNAPSAPDLAGASDSGTSNSDNITSATTPTLTGTAEAGAMVTLYDTDGTTVLGTATATGGAWSITSATLAAGTHTLSAKATDTAGNTGAASGSLQVTVDTTAPTNTVASAAMSGDGGISSSDFITKNTAQTISGTLAANLASGESVEVSIDNGGTWSAATATAGQSTWSQAATLSASGTLKVRVVDTAGNAGTAYSQAYTLDTVAPSVNIASSASALKVGETATITFTFSEDPGSTFMWDGSTGDVTVSGGTLGAISGSGLTRTATFTPTASTNGGSASIAIGAGAYTDTAGNSGGAGSAATLTYDTLAPNAPSAPDLAGASDSGTSNSDNITNATTPTLTGTAEAGAMVTLYDTDGTTVLGTTTATGGAWSITSATLAAGTHTLTAKATDTAGNAGAASSGLAITIDTVTPTLAITSDKAALKAGETATITFTFSEDPGATFVWDGSVGDVTLSGGTLGAISGSGLTRTATFTPTASTNGGTAGITVASGAYTDAAGNNGGAGTTPSVTFDTLAPVAPSAPSLSAASDTGESSSDGLTRLSSLVLSGTAEAGATVTLYDTNGTTVVGTGVATGGNWNITTGALGNGNHSITARATDAAGNHGAASAAVAVTVDQSAPAAPTVSLARDTGAADGITSDGQVSVTGIESGASWEYSTDGGGSWTGGSGDSFTLTGDGAKAVLVRQSDGAGNTGAGAALAFKLDTSAISGTTIALSDTALKRGEKATVTVAFAAPVAGFDASDLRVANGAISGLASTDGGKTWSGVFTPDANVAGAGGNITLDLGGVTTLAGTPGSGTAASPSFIIDTVAPTSTVGVADAVVGNGGGTIVTIRFSEAVTDFGLDDLAAGNGTLSNLSSSDGGVTWTATLTPAHGVTAPGNVVTVHNAGVRDAAGNSGAGSAVSNPYTVNTQGIGGTVTVSDADLLAGETAQVTVKFTEKANGDVAGAVAAKNGILGPWSASADGMTWTASLTPQDNVTAAQNVVSLNLAALTDSAGKPGQGTVLSGNYGVHTVRPHATIGVLSDTLLKGESSEVRIVFSEAVTGFGIEDLKVPNASLASLSSGDGGTTWAAKLIPLENISAPLNVIELDLSGVRNAAGNGANPGLGKVQSNVYAIATLDGMRSTVDGVATISQSTPGDSAGGKTVVVPVIATSRPDDPASEHSTLADIPLGITTGQGGNSLLVSLPTGTGIQAEGPAAPLSGSQALTDLIQRIESKTAPGSNTQSDMTGLGAGFLGELGNRALETKTLVPTASAGAASAGTIIISGNSANPVGLVIDTSHLPKNSTLQLDNVDFAAVVGNVTLRGGEGRNIVIGDEAVQNIFLGAEDDQLAGGGGDDFVGSAGGNDNIDGGSGNDVVAGGIGNDTLSGGTGADMVQGGRSDMGNWKLTMDAAGVLTAVHTNAVFAAGGAETLQRGDFNPQGEHLGFLAASGDALVGTALLYRAAFGRAPDLEGLSFWTQQGMQPRDVAQGILRSAEWLSGKDSNLTDTAFLQTLYHNALGREIDTEGLQYWTGVLTGAGGAPRASRADVLRFVALSDEHRKVAATMGAYVIGEAHTTREMGWIAGSGDDVLSGGAGSDVLVGGDGNDTVVYGGKLADYRFLLGSDGQVKVADKANADVDILSSVETGTFSDGSVDLHFLQSKASDLAALGMLYQSVLDRAGDLDGFQWWLGRHGVNAALVQDFLAAPEVKARYDGLGDAAYVQALYGNAGLLPSAAGGVESWTAYAATHTRAELVGAWIANSDVQAAQFGTQGMWLV